MKIRPTSWDDVINMTFVEVRKNMDLPDLSRKDIETFHKKLWEDIRLTFKDRNNYRLKGTLNFYLKKKELLKKQEYERKKEEGLLDQ